MSPDKNPLPGKIYAPIKSVFIEHPESVGETYFQHQRAAAGFAGSLIVASAAAIVHAVIPCLCEKTASNKIAELNAKLQSRASNDG